MTPRFTLIAFNCHEVDLKNGLNLSTPLARVIESTRAHRAEIYLGAYVFDTQKGWQDMHQLCEFLRTHRRTFLRLPFEGELFVYSAVELSEALEKLGVTLYKFPQNGA